MKKSITIFLFVLFTAAPFANAYEPELVHHTMTRMAFDAARNRSDFLKIFNLTPQSVFENKTAQQWCADGGRDEDSGIRMLSHFYDSHNDIPLSIGPCPKFTVPFARPAPDWGIDHGSNSYDIEAARKDYRDAIAMPTQAQRDRALAHLFYSLGHVMHLIEDMAQPEHTRNDQHLFPSSLYEHYTADLFDTNQQGSVDPLTFMSGYPVVQLPGYRDYFTNAAHRGMSDYSNRNFVTQDTNFYDPVRRCPRFDYPEPRLSSTTATTSVVPAEVYVLTASGYNLQTINVNVTYLRRNVPDLYDSARTASDKLVATRSFLDFETKDMQGVEVYSENDEVYREKASLLTPRAVGYAAGLLDYFFRGRVAAEWSEIAPTLANLKLTNKSQQTLEAGTVKIYVGIVSGSTDIVTPLMELNYPTLAPNAFVELGLDLTDSGLTVKDFLKMERRLVVTGTLGTETGAVIGLISPPERGRVLGLKFSGYSQMAGLPATLESVRIGGSGPNQVVATLAGGEDPWAIAGRTTRQQGSISPDGTKAAFKIFQKLVVYDFASGQIVAFDGTSQGLGVSFFDMTHLPAWSPDGTRIALYADLGRDSPPEQPDRRRRGLAIVNLLAGNVSFQRYSQLDAPDAVADANPRNYVQWSPDGRYVYAASICCMPTALLRFDLFSNQVEKLPATGKWFDQDFDVSNDGTKLYGVAYDASTATRTIHEVNWPLNTWTSLGGTARLETSPTLSPDGTVIAYGHDPSAAGCSGPEIWIYTFATGKHERATQDCSGSAGQGVVWWNLQWLP